MTCYCHITACTRLSFSGLAWVVCVGSITASTFIQKIMKKNGKYIRLLDLRKTRYVPVSIFMRQPVDHSGELWNFRTKELSFPGTKVPWVELSFLGTFVPKL